MGVQVQKYGGAGPEIWRCDEYSSNQKPTYLRAF